MKKKLSVVVLAGGQSTEHEISLLSASNVIAAIDQNKYNVAIVYISHEGAWYYTDQIAAYLAKGPEVLVQEGVAERVLCQLGAGTPSLVACLDTQKTFPIDCVLPLLHGTYGEDGCVQGLLQLMNVAYVGADVLSSAMCMNKAITKQILAAHGISTAPGRLLTKVDVTEDLYARLVLELGSDLFIKPVSLGSSVGISRVKTSTEFSKALQEAFRYDRYVLVERRIHGREIECAVLGNDDPMASLPSEIVSHHDFYSYEAKYLDPEGATTVVPADLPKTVVDRVRELSIAAFKALCCRGLLRVDFFVADEANILINEVNTIPGFTAISMYPKMWQATGVGYTELLDRLIALAMEHHEQQANLVRAYITLNPKPSTPLSDCSQVSP